MAKKNALKSVAKSNKTAIKKGKKSKKVQEEVVEAPAEITRLKGFKIGMLVIHDDTLFRVVKFPDKKTIQMKNILLLERKDDWKTAKLPIKEVKESGEIITVEEIEDKLGINAYRLEDADDVLQDEDEDEDDFE